jgi:predicted PurR-regulated permease PerM
LALILVSNQFEQLAENLPRSLERLREYIPIPAWSQALTSRLSEADQRVSTDSNLFSGITAMFSTTRGMWTNLVIILTVGVYTAAAPHTYIHGFIHWIPSSKQARMQHILDELHETLQRWLVGTAISMGAIALLTTLGLWLLDVPLALILGLLAGLLEFIPFIGPLLSVVPAALLGLLDSPTTALYVILLYLAIQQLEGLILMPLIQQRAIHLPPALIITAQLVIGVLVGGIGLLFATPLTAVAVVLIKSLYVEDVLEAQPGDQSTQP